MIPKIIHYCWFGGKELPPDVKKQIHAWKTKLPDYQIIEWNEQNFSIDQSIPYVKEAYNAKKWAFVSDYVRLFALYSMGGIYLDTDVEILKKFDDLLEREAFIGFESKYSLCTAVIGAEKGSLFIKKLLQVYDGKAFHFDEKNKEIPNSQLIFIFLNKKFRLKPADSVQQLPDCTVFPSDYFSPINCYTLQKKVTGNSYTIHWFAGTWKSADELRKEKVKSFFTRIVGEDFREKLKRLIKG